MPEYRHCRHCLGGCPGDCLIGDSGRSVLTQESHGCWGSCLGTADRWYCWASATR